MYDAALAAERVAAAAEAAHGGPVRIVLTARCEHHIRGIDDLDATIARLQAYQEAGADVLYAPGIVTADQIRSVVSSVDRPVNVLALPGVPTVAELAELGVARVSVGSGFSLVAYGALADAAKELLEQGTYGWWEQAGAAQGVPVGVRLLTAPADRAGNSVTALCYNGGVTSTCESQAAPAAMTLHVRYSSHLDLLADELAEQLATPPADPFEPIVVAVPTAGVRDWLTRRLAERLGVAANIVMPFPGRFLAAALGTPLDADDPWRGRPAGVGRARRARLGRRRRAGLARRSRRRRCRDATPRPGASPTCSTATPPLDRRSFSSGAAASSVTARSGAAVGGGDDADGGVGCRGIDPASQWQFDLWRAVRERVGEPSPAERLPDLVPSAPRRRDRAGVADRRRDVRRRRAGADPDSTSSRRSPRSATSRCRWSPRRRRVGLRASPVDPARLMSRRTYDERSSDEAGHPLIDSWGRLGIETAALLRGVEHSGPTPGGSDDDPDAPPPATLLAHIQRDIRRDRPPTPYAGPPEYASRVSSLQVHACHGATRQLEVLRDVLGHLFTADPELRPSDVLVLCPDIGRFEPFAAAVFARGVLPVPVEGERPVARRREPDRGRARRHHAHGRRSMHHRRRARRRRPGAGPRAARHHGRRPRDVRHVDRPARHHVGPRRRAPARLARHRHRVGNVGVGARFAAARRRDAGTDEPAGVRRDRAARRRVRRRVWSRRGSSPSSSPGCARSAR